MFKNLKRIAPRDHFCDKWVKKKIPLRAIQTNFLLKKHNLFVKKKIFCKNVKNINKVALRVHFCDKLVK